MQPSGVVDPVAEFIIDFCILAVETGWPANALQGVLLNALNDPMKDQLASRKVLL